MSNRIDEILTAQRKYFESGATLSVSFRRKMLKRLYGVIEAREEDIVRAIHSDLGKSHEESYMCEIGMALSEISHMIKHIGSYAKERTVKSPLAQFASRSYTKPTPYGNILIMSPWNYPFLLTVGPLVDAMAAGNTAIIKPSAYSPATGALIAKLLGETFEERYIAVITGGRAENAALLHKKFDLVFFTGSQNVGREVLRCNAETLTPTVLELGGKNPCIVDSTAKISLAARRIVFGKYLNCGQTCLAPDYILCDSSVKGELTAEIKKQIVEQYTKNALDNECYGRIVNEKHFDRILSLIDESKLIFGGEYDRERLKISPTVMDNVTFSDAVMQEEIFGPVLPILSFDDKREVFLLLKDMQKPLALYVFSEDKKYIREVTERIAYGGGCVNDVVIHLANTSMGFGGVGESGMGAYHGKVGFDSFSHTKSIVDKKTFMDFGLRYQPYNKKTLGLLKRFLK